MLFRIKHKTTYKYSREVFLEPHTVRLRPRTDVCQNLREFRIDVSPEPAGVSYLSDAGGDTVFLWFDDMTDSLTIKAESVVSTARVNPYDFILSDERSHSLPMEYAGAADNILSTYRTPFYDIGPRVEALIAEELMESGADTLKFLTGLNARIHDDFEYEIRREGDAKAPEQTATDKKGSCRDFVTLFNVACRSLGLAARFVSGYSSGGPEGIDHELHAWSEVYLPGGGWRGFDPTLGLAVSNQHVALVSGLVPDDASPVSGSFRGTGAEAEMDYEIELEVT